MGVSQAHIKATSKYNAKAYDQFTTRVKKGQAEIITAYAASKGLSLNGYINKLIADDMGEALTVPEKKQG